MAHNLGGRALENERVLTYAFMPTLVARDGSIVHKLAGVVLCPELLRIVDDEGNVDCAVDVACTLAIELICCSVMGAICFKLCRIQWRDAGVERGHQKQRILMLAIHESIPFPETMIVDISASYSGGDQVAELTSVS